VTNIRGERSVEIQRPLGSVYQYVADFHRHHEWNHELVEVTAMTDGPIRVGTKLRARERAPGSVSLLMKLLFPILARWMGIAEHTEAEVVELEPGKRLAWNAFQPLRNGEIGVRSEWIVEFEEQNGATKVTQRYHFIPLNHRVQRMMKDERKAARMIGEEVALNLGHLRQILEDEDT
jgi:uncharacterized membrane protein